MFPQELNVAVEQRLKWACGANPEVQEVFDAYSTAFVGQAAALKAVSALMKAVSGAAGAVLHHESLRAHRSPEAVINIEITERGHQTVSCYKRMIKKLVYKNILDASLPTYVWLRKPTK